MTTETQKALFALEKRMEAARRAALRPFHSRTAEEVERELAQLNAEYEAVLAAAAETPTARVEAAYAAATGRWSGAADWLHEYLDGVWQPCRGGHEADCYICAASAEAAEAAEVAAAAAIAAARAGDWAAAVKSAQRAARHEAECGGERRPVSRPEDAGDLTPTWGAFVSAVLTAAAEVAS